MQKKWVSTDGWRGYYIPIPKKGWELLLHCSVVNEAGQQLGQIVKDWLKKEGIKHRSGFLRTSNVFSAHYYIMTESGKIEKNLREKIEEWFIRQNNNTFSIFTGESRELDETTALKLFKEIVA